MMNNLPTQNEKNATTAVSLATTLAQQFATRADEADRQGILPEEDVAALKQSGYLGISVPREFGGYGLSLRDCVAAQLALAQGSTSTAIVAGMQVHIFGHQREVRTWDDAWYEKFCRLAASGALFNSIASEPALGSPSRGGLPATTAVPVQNGEGWVVNGRKTWSTGGKHLTHMLVRVDLAGEGAVVLLEQNMPGVSWITTWSDSLSLRASDSHDVLFDNVHIPQNYVIEQGGRSPQPNLWFPMIMSTIYLGAAMAARNRVIQFALERVPTALGKPIATLPKIQRQIGEIDVALQAARSLLFDVAGEWSGDDADRTKMSARIAAAKTMVTETANKVTDQALRIAGGSSITKALPLERYFRDVRAGAMQPPSGDTALEMVGRAAIAEFED
ncbi:MAG: acyl-CoA/acyl-ACP dehydrogenase [Ardenticatenaceae bacterium]|nr:acyl-CoA/acyl-ACP dehydrogenase [Anaerolineales bacterium]MCB8937661.1 acyl-CoA/acyl-ACP dehydrogenase [Ardenticatenaceae bacterium]MCB8974230.1 acyl-CoA/acyl-ACP dehydrogenase [Ardenticatenaceae bacterium]